MPGDDGGVNDSAWLSVAQLLAAHATGPVLDPSGHPRQALQRLDLEPLGPQPSATTVAQIAAAIGSVGAVVVARCTADQVEAVQPVANSCTTTLVTAADTARLPRAYVAVADVDQAAKVLSEAVVVAPQAALVLDGLLRTTADLDVRSGLYAESAAYSLLLAGTEFATWRAGRPRRPVADPAAPAALVQRVGDELSITLNRPEQHNAFDRWVRDATCDALDIARLDPTISSVRLTGAGPSFCSGGHLDEFGTQPDLVRAHLIRLERSVGWRMHELGDRLVAELHGACIGAGIELPAFAGRVVARDDTWFQLPELGMGLIPGAGGTVSLPRRIGRWRTAWLALSGERLDVDTAHRWGLVDARA
jgi:hypothetical protein